MQTPSLETLTVRVEKIERQNHRLKRVVFVLGVLFVASAGWAGYRAIAGLWRPGTMTQGVTLYSGNPFSFGEMATLAMGGAVIMDSTRGFRGGISAHPREDYTGLYFTNERRHRAGLSVSERGAFLILQDSTNAVYLGPGLYDDHQLLLELVSQDGRQGIRLGLDSNQQPLFQVIRDGQATSFLEEATTAGTMNQPPVHGVTHE